MQFNVCEGCGASNGRVGLLISSPDIADGKRLCMNCRDTAKTGNPTVHTELPRTEEELEKMIGSVPGAPKQLWAVEVVGPDDWYAARSLQDAREYAADLNAAIMARRPADELEPNIWAIPRAVSWTEAQHTKGLELRDRSNGKKIVTVAVMPVDDGPAPFDG